MDDGELFRQLYPALRRFAAVVAPRGADADDLVQEALARTLRRGSLSALDQPQAYLRRAVLNLATTQRTTSSRRARLDASRGRGDDTAHDQYPSDLDELRAIDPDQRAVLYLHLVERATHDEIAATLGITAEASRARLSRGLRRLRVDLDEQEAHR